MTVNDAYQQGVQDADNVYSCDEAPPDVVTLAEEYVLYHAWDDETEDERRAIAAEWARGWHACASRAWDRCLAETEQEDADA